MAINGNKLAQAVAKREGGKQNLSIAQVKEVIRALRIELSESSQADEYYDSSDILKWLGR